MNYYFKKLFSLDAIKKYDVLYETIYGNILTACLLLYYIYKLLKINIGLYKSSPTDELLKNLISHLNNQKIHIIQRIHDNVLSTLLYLNDLYVIYKLYKNTRTHIVLYYGNAHIIDILRLLLVIDNFNITNVNSKYLSNTEQLTTYIKNHTSINYYTHLPIRQLTEMIKVLNNPTHDISQCVNMISFPSNFN